jgi:O-antigen biosynthesis protein
MSASISKTPGDQPSVSSPPPNAAAHWQRPLDICIASPEFIGPSPHGATGIAYTAMAQALAAAGHKVTCLFLDAKVPSTHEWQRWVEKYKCDGLTLVALPQINASELVAPANLIKSYEAYQWLKKNDRFDIIHFPERQGPGYHTLTAKHHGLAFGRATVCVGLHAMTTWLQAADPKPVNTLAEVDTEFMERRAVALADAVVSPSQNLVNWISEQRRGNPGSGNSRQAIPPHSARPAQPPVAPHWQEINELVYFGTLETSKGAALFCDALDAVPAAIAKKLQTVAFLGKEAVIDGIPALDYVRQRAQRWPFPFQMIADLHETSTMDYLRQKNRLAVIPTLRESSPYGVLECLVARIAFVASRVGGITELIAPADVSKVCFEPNASALCAILCAALTEGIRPARAVVDARDNEPALAALHENSPIRSVPASLLSCLQSAPRSPDFSFDAAQAAIQALSIDPTNAIALKVLARIHLNAGLHEAAQEACHLILKGNAEDAEALQMIEEARIRETKLEESAVASARSPQESRRRKALQAFAAGFAPPFACP